MSEHVADSGLHGGVERERILNLDAERERIRTRLLKDGLATISPDEVETLGAYTKEAVAERFLAQRLITETEYWAVLASWSPSQEARAPVSVGAAEHPGNGNTEV